MSSSLVPIQAKADESPRSNLAKPSAVRGAGAVVSTVVSAASSSSPPPAVRPVTVDSSAPTSASAASAKKASFDFITSSNAVKDIFMLPYAINRPVSVAIHNVDGTLILEDANDHPAGARFNRQVVAEPIRNTNPESVGTPSLQDEPDKADDDENDTSGDYGTLIRKSASLTLLDDGGSPQSTEALTIVNTVLQQQQQLFAPTTTPSHPPLSNNNIEDFGPVTPEPREYRTWHFQDMKMLVGTNALVYGSSATVRLEDAAHLHALSQQHERDKVSGAFLADHQLVNRKPSYAEAVARQVAVPTPPSPAVLKDNTTILVDQVQLQSCIIPAPAHHHHHGLGGGNLIRTTGDIAATAMYLSPVTTVLDTYLDNIMANVPQLALCLQEKGFVRSIKLMNTEEIPSRMLHSQTVDTSIPFEAIQADPHDPSEKIFTPEIMEMNAHALLRFLKTNCAKDNATYLLRREAGCTNVQLFDISSAQPQWIWRLAMMSYRFANRLRHLGEDSAQRRSFRARQRSLLQNTLDLLEMLGDMNGNRHESLVASVNENLADTFLTGGSDEGEERPEVQPTQAATPIAPPPLALSIGQPYANVSVDSLGKAQTRLTYGIKVLQGLLDQKMRLKHHRVHRRHSSEIVESVAEGSDDDDTDENNDDLDEIGPAAIQLVGMQKKTIDVTLCMAMEDLKLYWTSSAMHNLRKASHLIVDALQVVALTKEEASWLKQIRQQYGWMWEMCGHFARSFASDEKWRDQGHSSGDDVVAVLRDMEALFDGKNDLVGTGAGARRLDFSMHELSGIIQFECPRVKFRNDADSDKQRQDAMKKARDRLDHQTTIHRERRFVLVGACLAYDRALSVFDNIPNEHAGGDRPWYTLQQRLGDACNETGKVLLNELRSLISSSGKGNTETAFVAEALCGSAEYWLTCGLQCFSLCKDVRNLALLHCNLCQCYKLRANSIFGHIIVCRRKPTSTHAEECLESAALHLQEAHSALEVRHADSKTWDMVSIELAATYLVLGVRRRQRLVGAPNPEQTRPSALDSLSPGEEKSVIEPIEKAKLIYETIGNVTQTAASHYQLALFYCKIWTRQRDESKTREKLSLAFSSFQTALKLFGENMDGNEMNYSLVAIDFASFYSSLSDEGALTKALRICVETSKAMSFEVIVRINASVAERDSSFEQLRAICTSVDETTFGLLKSLIKISSKHNDSYKALYRAGLRAKANSASVQDDFGLGNAAAEATAKVLLSLRSILNALDTAWKERGIPDCNV